MISRLIIGNSYSTILDLDPDKFEELRDRVSYTIPMIYGISNRPQKRHLMDRKGNFPSGLLNLVQSYLVEQNLKASVEDSRIVPTSGIDHKLKLLIKPYYEQLCIVKAATSTVRGTISACTGFGKSIAMALTIQTIGMKTLVIVPNLELKKQLTETFKTIFGDLSGITITNIDDPKLKSAKDYDCLIIDEAHHVAAKTYRLLNKTAWNNIYHRYFFTATPFRSKDEEQLLFESIAGQVIYRVDYKTAVTKGYIVPIEAYYVEVNSPKSKETKWASFYSKSVVNNDRRNDIIAQLMGRLYRAGASTLVLVKELKHGDILSSITGAGFANGQSEDTPALIKAFNQKKIHTLIGTVGILGEGVDTKPAEYIIIAGLGKSKPQFMQQVGRAVRTYPGKESAKVIIILDRCHKFSISHFKAQLKVLKEEYQIVATKLEI